MHNNVRIKKKNLLQPDDDVIKSRNMLLFLYSVYQIHVVSDVNVLVLDIFGTRA